MTKLVGQKLLYGYGVALFLMLNGNVKTKLKMDSKFCDLLTISEVYFNFSIGYEKEIFVLFQTK